VNAENKSVQAHLDGVTPEKRRRDAETLLDLMSRVTGRITAAVGQCDRLRPIPLQIRKRPSR
jgi:hypothetical protein